MWQSAELIRKKQGTVRATNTEFSSVGDTSVIRLFFALIIPTIAGEEEVLFRAELGMEVIEVSPPPGQGEPIANSHGACSTSRRGRLFRRPLPETDIRECQRP